MGTHDTLAFKNTFYKTLFNLYNIIVIIIINILYICHYKQKRRYNSLSGSKEIGLKLY